MLFGGYGIIIFICAVISAKWAMELGLSQGRQILWGIGGLIFGPLMLLNAYIYLVRKDMESEAKR